MLPGYFMFSDDMVFNVWHPMDLSVGHVAPINDGPGPW